MKTKYKLPKDVYQAALWIIRGQQRREKVYRQKRDDILNGGGAKYITYHSMDSDDKKEYRAYLPAAHSNQSATEIKALALAALEDDSETKKMHCVNEAIYQIGNDIADNNLKNILRKYILLNINDRREYSYDKLYLPGISKKKFYQYKSEFIYIVALKNNLYKN